MTEPMTDKTTQADKAIEIEGHCGLSEDARGLLEDGLSCDEFVEKLAGANLIQDACQFLGQWLGKRACLWWGCQCLWLAIRPHGDERQEACLNAAAGWVLEPTEAHRRIAGTVSQSTGTPGEALAFAAFCTGGSLLQPDLPVVAPPEHLTGEVVAQAVLLTAIESGQFEATGKQLIALGVDIAQGKNLWEEKA